MAGLNFQTQTIINSNLDPDSGKEVKLFEAKGETLYIKRDFQFHKKDVNKGTVVAIRKRDGYKASLCKATIDFSDATLLAALTAGKPKTYCRLDIYLGVEGAEPYIYSTPWVQKGMPFWIEFTVNGAFKADEADEAAKAAKAAAIAENVAALITKNHVFQCDKDLINISVEEGGKLVLEGATEYQRFRKIEISTLSAEIDNAEKIAELGDAAITLDERGKNSFGTYSQIIKDLRLPTAANYQWTHIRQVETPIVGAIYNQYIIEYEAPASNDGLHAVGQRMASHTTHVFWVKNDTALITKWEEALETIGTVVDAG